MVHSLITNKSVEKILFFLLLNSKCYAAQLSHRFKTPLTPLQHALGKLEKNGVLISHVEGKTRFFEFNPSYHLLPELETLLKKSYLHLSSQQKKLYYSPLFPVKTPRPTIGKHSSVAVKTLDLVWAKLQSVQTLCFSAKSKSIGSASVSGWNGIGKGNVEIKRAESAILIFNERGSWTSEDHKQFEFSNVFRWTFQPEFGSIMLEHLRFGVQNPVFLFSLAPIDAHTLESVDSHVCNGDSYFGQLRFDKHYLQFNWRVIGPKKNEEIDYLYT
jgi:hypothetical protein